MQTLLTQPLIHSARRNQDFPVAKILEKSLATITQTSDINIGVAEAVNMDHELTYLADALTIRCQNKLKEMGLWPLKLKWSVVTAPAPGKSRLVFSYNIKHGDFKNVLESKYIELEVACRDLWLVPFLDTPFDSYFVAGNSMFLTKEGSQSGHCFKVATTDVSSVVKWSNAKGESGIGICPHSGLAKFFIESTDKGEGE